MQVVVNTVAWREGLGGVGLAVSRSRFILSDPRREWKYANKEYFPLICTRDRYGCGYFETAEQHLAWVFHGMWSLTNSRLLTDFAAISATLSHFIALSLLCTLTRDRYDCPVFFLLLSSAIVKVHKTWPALSFPELSKPSSSHYLGQPPSSNFLAWERQNFLPTLSYARMFVSSLYTDQSQSLFISIPFIEDVIGSKSIWYMKHLGVNLKSI